MLRTVFLGSDAIAVPLLDWLVGDEGRSAVDLVAVFTQPDRPVGRGQKVQPNAIKQWALARGLPVHQPERLGEAELALLRDCRADVSLVMAYGHILRQNFIAAPRLGTLNLHASLLPELRGASPIQTAVASGRTKTGVALMRIVPELDAGPVADREAVPIGPLDTALEIEAKLAGACVPLLTRTLPRLAAGQLAFVEQVHAEATFCRKLEKSDGVLDFTAPAATLAARINGLFPWPACTVEIAGQPVKLGLADVADHGDRSSLLNDYASGAVLGHDADGLLVATGQGVLRLRRLQRPGGKMLSAADFLRGFPVPVGTVLPAQPLPPLEGRQPFRRPKT